jgi:hypothetical protein
MRVWDYNPPEPHYRSTAGYIENKMHILKFIIGQIIDIIHYQDSPLYPELNFITMSKDKDQQKRKLQGIIDNTRREVIEQMNAISNTLMPRKEGTVEQQLEDEIVEKIMKDLGIKEKKPTFVSYASYGSIWDFGWASFYDYFQEIGVVQNDDFTKFKELLKSGVYDQIQLAGVCICSNMPTQIHADEQNRLHSEDSPAIAFSDGYEVFFWHGIPVPEHWIMDKMSIDKQDIRDADNAEKRRCIMEIIGAERYYEQLGGVTLIDEDKDAYGKPMKLYRSKDKDDIIRDYVYFLSVTDTSTDRVYNIYPNVKQFPKAKENVWAAKASTFNKTAEEFKPIEES